MNQVQFSVFMQIDDMNASNNYQKGMQNTMGIVFGGFLNDFRFTQTIKYSNQKNCAALQVHSGQSFSQTTLALQLIAQCMDK